MSILIAVMMAAAVGYFVSVFTWPTLRQALIGIEAEIEDLRARARALEMRLQG
jgi:hypothetical protein